MLIVEVLSPSTERRDRGFKFAQYRRMESLQEYALVSQEKHRVEVFRRQANREWVLAEFLGSEAAARFDSIGAVIPLGQIYAKVPFEGPGPETPPHPAE